jgi:tRNA threonylcarbamoyladenosine biosynthesis protein TsaE
VYTSDKATVYHYDMYRVNSWEDLYSTGFLDIADENAYVLAEWSENIFGALADDVLVVRIDKLGDNRRCITLMTKEEAENESIGD